MMRFYFYLNVSESVPALYFLSAVIYLIVCV